MACLKAEAVPSPPRVSALLEGMKRQVPILGGLGALYGIYDLERGSHGFMTGFAFPEVLMALTSAAKAGRWDEAWRIFTHFLPLIVFEQQPGLAVRKELYRMRGLIGGHRVRHPGATIDPATAAHLRGVVERVVPGVDITRPVPVAAVVAGR